VTRFSVDLGPEAVRAWRISAVLSPDGTRLVYTARTPDGALQLHTRRLDQSSSTVLAPLESSIDAQPFFSPDGEWIGFRSGARMMKVPAQGGSTVTLGDVPAGGLAGASWGDDDRIILGTTAGMLRMPGAGGTPQPLKSEPGSAGFPQVLPGAKAVVFVTSNNAAAQSFEECDIQVLEFAGGAKKTLLHGGYSPRYLPTSGETGHLVYMHEGTLFGVGFDPKRLELIGTPAALLDDVGASAAFTDGGGQFAFSNTGTFVYLSGRRTYPVMLLDTSGATTPALAEPGLYGALRFSPDGRKFGYIASGSKGFDVWVYDLDRRVPTQLTFQGATNHELAWAGDSKHLVYSDGNALWWIRADGSGQAQLLADKIVHGRPGSFSPADSSSTATLVFDAVAAALTPAIFTLPVDLSDPERPKPGKAGIFAKEPGVVYVDPVFSPDGKFIAYASDESGRVEVWVRPFPGPGGKWKVSTSGGQFPVWSAARHELFFLGADDRIMTAGYTIEGTSFRAGAPRVWSLVRIRRTGILTNFDVSPDGKRAAMFPHPDADAKGGSLHATFLLNYFDEVRRKAPVSRK
jgi:serine/threonine-protein kinase